MTFFHLERRRILQPKSIDKIFNVKIFVVIETTWIP